MPLLLLLAACFGPSERGFPDAYAEQLCRYDEHCHKSLFVEDHDDVDACVDELLEDLDEGADCAFDADEARECLAEMRDARRDCDDEDRIPRACLDAFDCPGVLPSQLSAETFFQGYLDTFCSLTCGNSYLEEICDNPDNYVSQAYECPDFDRAKAEECLDPANWSCSDDYGYGESFPVAPRACSEVCYAGYGYDDVDTGY